MLSSAQNSAARWTSGAHVPRYFHLPFCFSPSPVLSPFFLAIKAAVLDSWGRQTNESSISYCTTKTNVPTVVRSPISAIPPALVRPVILIDIHRTAAQMSRFLLTTQTHRNPSILGPPSALTLLEEHLALVNRAQFVVVRPQQRTPPPPSARPSRRKFHVNC